MITFKYFNTLLQLNHQPYKILKIKFGPSTNQLKRIDIINGFSNIKHLDIFIEIVCETKNNKTSVKYSLANGRIKHKRPKTCKKFRPTIRTDTTTTTTTTKHTLTEATITSSITPTNVPEEMTSAVLTLTTTLIDLSTTAEATNILTVTTLTSTIIPKTVVSIITHITRDRTLESTQETAPPSQIMTLTASSETTRHNLANLFISESTLITSAKLFIPQTMLTTSKQTRIITSEIQTLAVDTTTTIIFHINTSMKVSSSSTQLPSSINFFLLFLLLSILFVLIICVLISSIWIFFRHNYRKRHMIDHHLNIMTNIERSNIDFSTISNTSVTTLIK